MTLEIRQKNIALEEAIKAIIPVDQRFSQPACNSNSAVAEYLCHMNSSGCFFLSY